MLLILSWFEDNILKSEDFVCSSDSDFEYFDYKLWKLLNKGYVVSIYVADDEK